MKIHPAAAVFPMLEESELNELAADIKAHGLLHPIVVSDDVLAVSYRDATLQHWKRKEENKTQVIDSTTARRESTREVIAQLEPEMVKRPDLTTGEWMRERGFGQ